MEHVMKIFKTQYPWKKCNKHNKSVARNAMVQKYIQGN